MGESTLDEKAHPIISNPLALVLMGDNAFPGSAVLVAISASSDLDAFLSGVRPGVLRQGGKEATVLLELPGRGVKASLSTWVRADFQVLQPVVSLSSQDH